LNLFEFVSELLEAIGGRILSVKPYHPFVIVQDDRSAALATFFGVGGFPCSQ